MVLVTLSLLGVNVTTELYKKRMSPKLHHTKHPAILLNIFRNCISYYKAGNREHIARLTGNIKGFAVRAVMLPGPPVVLSVCAMLPSTTLVSRTGAALLRLLGFYAKLNKPQSKCVKSVGPPGLCVAWHCLTWHQG